MNLAAHFLIALRFLSASSRLCCSLYILYILLWLCSWDYSERGWYRAAWWYSCWSSHFSLLVYSLGADNPWWWRCTDCWAFWVNSSSIYTSINQLSWFWRCWFFISIVRSIGISQSTDRPCFWWYSEERGCLSWNLIVTLLTARPIIWNCSSLECWFWWVWLMNSANCVLSPWSCPSQTHTSAWRGWDLRESGWSGTSWHCFWRSCGFLWSYHPQFCARNVPQQSARGDLINLSEPLSLWNFWWRVWNCGLAIRWKVATGWGHEDWGFHISVRFIWAAAFCSTLLLSILCNWSYWRFAIWIWWVGRDTASLCLRGGWWFLGPALR